jgi:APA family basic amino acid/polyamine antiporter
MRQKNQTFTARTATSIIIANMVGMGVFTSLGFQLADINSVFALLMLWVIGGIAAFCGAVSYAELGAALPRSGGEYNFLGKLYHPSLGFVSGWVSATIGFAAPIAAVALAFAKYSDAALPGEWSNAVEKTVAVSLVLFLAITHSLTRNLSAGLQNVFTLIKIILIIGFCAAAFTITPAPQQISLLPQPGDFSIIFSAPFAVALIYVSYAYTGWNAATYIIGELDTPQTSLPKILMAGTAIVMVLYLLLNAAFLYAAPMEAMKGEVEIGYIAAQSIFGENGAKIAGAMLSLLLISSVSAMTISGPRALQVLGEDIRTFSWFSKTNDSGLPYIAIIFQSMIAIIFILTSSFKTIIIFAGSMLALSSFMTVLGLFILRRRNASRDTSYKAFAFPFTPIVYLLITGVTLIYVIQDNPKTALVGLSVILVGLAVYAVTRNNDKA